MTLDTDVSAFDGPAGPSLRPATTFLTQPDLPEPSLSAPAAPAPTSSTWTCGNTKVTAAEDPYLLEPALGGADTATRTRTVWQVRVEEGVTATDCGDVAGFPARFERGAADGGGAAVVHEQRALRDPPGRRLPRPREPALPRRDPQRQRHGPDLQVVARQRLVRVRRRGASERGRYRHRPHPPAARRA